ncbi:TonB family protein [Arenimonas donghaensis]|uniref:TonB C-terminal domain-containing protein n=1 Tax=Arenimonas donghaensis DSM 18148 = HO3-R19 TaxID=1121014 RepID=A0A087MG02_9GAMM|nr:TonB family protein [Arenimonas donghaensis]KFL35805.1 hypothetical protein N788_07095 [Arenimonas donghaensis DSM 18148 = HO3-R19]
MIADLLVMLAEAAVASAAALALVLVLRKAVRRRFGAEAAYALWLLLPFSLLAVALPTPGLSPELVTLRSAVVQALPADPGRLPVPVGEAAAGLAFAWLAGALLAGAWLLSCQRRFVAGLGPLRRRPDGLVQSLAIRGLPAVLGLRPRIVLPGDFDQRYSAIERELVLAHELLHLRRGDVPVNMLFGLLRCLLWFNPLIHLSAGLFRQDQELSCDAVVLRRHPGHRRTYGDAMLKTELADQPLPLGCTWSGSHPLKERLTMLKNSPVSTRRRQAGLFLASGLALVVSGLAWAVQPADAPRGNNMAESGIVGEAPSYPKAAADAGQGGVVMLRVLVGADGKAQDVQVDPDKTTVPADSALARSAADAAGTWSFNPAMKDGKAVPGWVMVPVRFEPPAVAPEAAPGAEGA